MTALESLRQHRARILEVASAHGATRVRVFGSVARGDAGATSDVDFLVAFEPHRSLLDHVSLVNALRELLGREVDVVSEHGLSPHLADRIVSEAAPL